MAASAPTSVEFQIHQVVHAFQTSVVIKQKKKKLNRFFVRSAVWSSGIHAIKTKKVKGETGHAAYNKIPERKAKPGNCIFFNQKNFGAISEKD